MKENEANKACIALLRAYCDEEPRRALMDLMKQRKTKALLFHLPTDSGPDHRAILRLTYLKDGIEDLDFDEFTKDLLNPIDDPALSLGQIQELTAKLKKLASDTQR